MGKPAFTVTFDQVSKASVDVISPGKGATLDNKLPDYDMELKQVHQGTTLEVTLNINNN